MIVWRMFCSRGTGGKGIGEGDRARQRLKVLLLLCPDPADALDRQRRAAGFLGDLAVLFHDVAARRLVAVQPAEQFGRHAPVGALRVVLIDDVEKGEFAFGIGPGFLGHGRAFRRSRRCCQRKLRCARKAKRLSGICKYLPILHRVPPSPSMACFAPLTTSPTPPNPCRAPPPSGHRCAPSYLANAGSASSWPAAAGPQRFMNWSASA